MSFSAVLSPTTPDPLGPQWCALGASGYWSTRDNIEHEIALASAVEALQGVSDTLRLPKEFLATRRQKFLEDKWAKVDFEEAEHQAQVIFDHIAVPHRLTIVTGPPGAAKTTVAAHWLRLARTHNSYLPILLITSEKEALQRLQDKMGEATPDRALMLDEALRAEKPWPKYACVLIDEAGLIDTHSMGNLLTQAVDAQAARVILVGDDKQLLPTGAGQPFRWIRENKKAQMIELLYSFRQKTPQLREALSALYSGDVQKALEKVIPSFVMTANLLTSIQQRLQQLPKDKTLVIVHGDEALREALRSGGFGGRILSPNEAQGLAFDNCVFVIAKPIDRTAMLVGCSRQRYSLDLFVDEGVYPTKTHLLDNLAEWQKKPMALDIVSFKELQIIDQG